MPDLPWWFWVFVFPELLFFVGAVVFGILGFLADLFSRSR